MTNGDSMAETDPAMIRAAVQAKRDEEEKVSEAKARERAIEAAAKAAYDATFDIDRGEGAEYGPYDEPWERAKLKTRESFLGSARLHIDVYEEHRQGDAVLFSGADVFALLSEAQRVIKRGEPCPSVFSLCRSLEGSGWRPELMPEGLPPREDYTRWLSG